MNASDISPHRMERARLKVADFARERKGLPLGLIAYAGSAHLVLPPTRDTAVVATMAAEISPEIMPQPGDDLTTALKLAQRSLGPLGGTVIVVADTVSSENQSALAEFRQQSRVAIRVLAVARPGTPEMKTLEQVASTLNASLTVMTPDGADIDRLVRQSAKTPVAISAAQPGTRWAESGWWLVPVLAIIVLASFRRQLPAQPQEKTP
jgi:Ca-activated chloride channel family protein